MPWSRRGGEALPVARTLQDAIAAGLLQPLDNAQVAHGAVAERAQRLPIGCAVMGGDGLLDARKFGNDDALAQAEAAWALQLAFLERVLNPGYNRARRLQIYECDHSADYDFTKNVRME